MHGTFRAEGMETENTKNAPFLDPGGKGKGGRERAYASRATLSTMSVRFFSPVTKPLELSRRKSAAAR